MQIDVALNPAEIARLPERDLSHATCVVFDVLRATSSMITGLAHGVPEIHPVLTIDEALALKARIPNAALGGERHGDRIDGFDVGNAPHEYLDLAGRPLITTTTNGTVALRACERASRVLVGAMLNLAVLADELRRAQPDELLLVCAGTFDEFALEDAVTAGLLVAELAGADLSDAAQAAAGIAWSYAEPITALRASKNGRALAAKGRGAEVEWCAQRSVFKVIGSMESAVIRPLAP